MTPEIEADYRAATAELIRRMAIAVELWQQEELPLELLNDTLLLQLVKAGEEFAAEKYRWREQQQQSQALPPQVLAPPSAEQLADLEAAAAARQQRANQWLQNRERSEGAPW